MKNNILMVIGLLFGMVFFFSISVFCMFKAIENYKLYDGIIYDASCVIVPTLVALIMLYVAHLYAKYAGYEIADYRAYLQYKKDKKND